MEQEPEPFVRDQLSTPAGTGVVLKRAADDVAALVRYVGVHPPASVATVLVELRRLLADTAVAATTGSQGDLHTLVLALTDVATRAEAIRDAAAATRAELIAADQAAAEHYRQVMAHHNTRD